MKSERKIGSERQETTMFLVEFMGDANKLKPLDTEISDIRFLDKKTVLKMLTHSEAKDYFSKHIEV